MRAILIATSPGRLSTGDHPDDLPALRPLIDRPFLQHLVEYLAAAGITSFDVVMCQTPENIRRLLEDGSRWGVAISYHTVKHPDQPYRLLSNQTASPVLLAHADRLCAADVSQDVAAAAADMHDICYNSLQEWTGWAWLTPSTCRKVAPTATADALHELLRAATIIELPALLKADTWPDVIDAQRQVIDRQFQGLMLTGAPVEPGIWLSRNVKMHPTARIVAPVYIGPDCDIGKRAKLGPNAVIGQRCVIDRHSVISNALVCPNTFVGQSLELDHVVADGNQLINTRIGSRVTITDTFILGNIARGSSPLRLTGLLEQALAGALLLPLLPLLLAVCLIRRLALPGPVFHTAPIVNLPTADDPAVWRQSRLIGFRAFTEEAEPQRATACMLIRSHGCRELLGACLPVLINVCLGRCHFVGLPPRTRQQIETLPEQWRTHYLNSKCGAITETLVNCGPQPSLDERFAAEAVYAVSAGFVYDIKLLGRYFKKCMGR